MTRRARFAPRVPCAIEPRAFGLFFDAPAPPVVDLRPDGIAIVSIRGPLVHHDDPYFDSYDAIKARTVATLGGESQPRAIVLSIDSPGGMVSGAFDTALELRDRCAAAGVPLYAYVDGQACSAAYALACAASRIVIPPTGIVGSIGCIAEIVDVSRANEAMGIGVTLIVSGKRKPDGNPNRPLDEAAAAAIQAQVMQLAGLFFEHVASSRPLQVDEIRALEAGLLVGESARAAGLVDEVASLDAMIAAIAAGTFGQVVAPAGAEGTETSMAKNAGATGTQAAKADEDADYEAAIATLRKAANAGNAKAKKMLQAEMADDEPDGDEAAAAPGAPAAAAPPPPAKDDEKDAKATANAALAEAKAARREAMLAARPDLSPELRASLEALEPDAVAKILAATPRTSPKLGTAAASTSIAATRGAGQVDVDGAAPVASTPERETQRAQLAAAMGVGSSFVQPQRGRADGRETYPALTRAEGEIWTRQREAEAKARAEALAKAATK